YLKQSRRLSEIAELLGYADQSAFGRAFKRWTGETPKQFRERHRVDSATHTSK
ncbi:AraC family transcriptional regulator, partial [uncultured Acinetobacter sp.]